MSPGRYRLISCGVLTTHVQEQGCCALRHLLADNGQAAVGELLRNDGARVIIAALDAKSPSAQAVWAVETLSASEEGAAALSLCPSALPSLLASLSACVRDSSAVVRILLSVSRLLTSGASGDAVCAGFVRDGGIGEVLAAGKPWGEEDVQSAVASVLSAAGSSDAVKATMVGRCGCGPSLSLIKAALKTKA